jgi:hypothetical protein
MSRLAKLCEILHDIESTTDHLTRRIEFAKEIAKSGPFFTEEMTMHLKWVGNMYTIVVRREALVKDLKREIHRALNVQPEVQKLMSWNVHKHAQPANDNTSIRDCDFAKDIRLIKIGKTYVRVVKYHFDMKKIIPVSPHLQKSLAYNAMKLKEIYSHFKEESGFKHAENDGKKPTLLEPIGKSNSSISVQPESISQTSSVQEHENAHMFGSSM